MYDADTITLYKNKGDHNGCKNYHGISLLNIVGKAFTRMVLKNLQGLAECIYPEAQCGFWVWRSKFNMIFSLCQAQEKCHKQRQPLYIVFINLTMALSWSAEKASFLYCRGLHLPLSSWGWLYPFMKVCKVLSSMMALSQTCSQLGMEWNRSAYFPWHSLASSSPCCCLKPSVSQKMAYISAPEVMETIISLTHLWAICEEYWLGICCLQMMLPWQHTHTQEAVQQLIICFTCACREFGLTISLKKTNIMGQNLSSIPSISIGNYILEVVEDFTYFHSMISSNLSLDAELNTQISKAATAMACLAKRFWENSMLTIIINWIVPTQQP